MSDDGSIACPIPAIAGLTVTTLLGQGGTATVWQARDGHHTVAVKLAHPGSAEAALRLRHEAELLAKIGPPLVPAMHRLGVLDDDTPYLVMDYIDRPTLAQRLAAQSGPEPSAALRTLAMGLAETVGQLHRRGIVHRDLKPSNIFADDRGILLIDVGLGRAGPHEPAVTRTGVIVGTPMYMAPEQCRGERDIDARADVYSLGAVLFEMITGRPPFIGEPTRVRRDHLTRRPPRARETRPSARCLPARRRLLSPAPDP
ncbi:MAG: serine/threonine-protein kinase [Myxococcota bacterium]